MKVSSIAKINMFSLDETRLYPGNYPKYTKQMKTYNVLFNINYSNCWLETSEVNMHCIDNENVSGQIEYNKWSNYCSFPFHCLIFLIFSSIFTQ